VNLPLAGMQVLPGSVDRVDGRFFIHRVEARQVQFACASVGTLVRRVHIDVLDGGLQLDDLLQLHAPNRSELSVVAFEGEKGGLAVIAADLFGVATPSQPVRSWLAR
jgi:hypothetical protein